ncbi:hypothetical protein L6164_003579 [Bauhinia variegata]|uniref:Uncharacterized protein n=1 Tax=Bauhinia variegata TaxID=167791 RepID=A0ACB9Q1T3_BAUVA|nr:hypothetical protein L6164_003579 [Bauhinia variegata]
MASRSSNGPNSYTALSEDQDAVMVQQIIDIPEVMEPDLSPECCINKVPEKLREVNPEAYSPELISIGPLHHDNPKLKPMEKEKYRYFHFFLKRVSRKHALDDFKSFLGDNEVKLRSFYSEKFLGLSKDQFVNIMLLDSIFIMELLLREAKSYQHQEDDNLFRKAWMKRAIQHDLLLLENQLPFFVLQELYNKAFSQNDSGFLHLAYKYFADFDPEKSSNEMIVPKHWKQSKHFTDLIRHFHIPEGFHHESVPLQVLKCATKLYNSGVVFKAIPNRCTLDIKVQKNLFYVDFKLPQLVVCSVTECVVRNIMALEQCYYPNNTFFCNYISVIDNLINTSEDVDLLIDKEVIVHHLGTNEEVATVINGLCKHVVTGTSCYSTHIRDLNAHYLNPRSHTVARLWTVYFKDYWRGSSTIVGVAVLFFTFFNFFRMIFE